MGRPNYKFRHDWSDRTRECRKCGMPRFLTLFFRLRCPVPDDEGEDDIGVKEIKIEVKKD